MNRNQNPPLLEVRDLSWRESGHLILDSVNWRVKAGEKWALLGENGSGKSSLLDCLTGWNKNHDGVVRWSPEFLSPGSQGLFSGDPGRDKIVVSYQHQFLNSGTLFTGRDILDLCRLTGRQTANLVEAFSLQSVLDVPLSALSGGELKRLAAGVCLFSGQPVLILDEPAASLDYRSQAVLSAQLRKLEADRTLILVSHHVALALETCDQVLGLWRGRVVLNKLVSDLTRRDILDLFQLSEGNLPPGFDAGKYLPH